VQSLISFFFFPFYSFPSSFFRILRRFVKMIFHSDCDMCIKLKNYNTSFLLHDRAVKLFKRVPERAGHSAFEAFACKVER